jgi:hypothetical protein
MDLASRLAMPTAPRLLFALLLPLAACDGGSLKSDAEQLTITDDALVDFDDGRPLLVGTELCPSISAESDALPSGDFQPLDCFAQSFEGPVEPAGECLLMTEPGTVDWTFTAQACAGNDFGWAPVDDHVAIEVVGIDDVEGHLPLRLEAAVADYLDDPTFVLTHPDDWLPADGEPLRLVAGQTVGVQPALRRVADDATVVWHADGLSGDGAVEIEVVTAEVGEHGDVEVGAGDPVERERVRRHLHRHRLHPGVSALGERSLEVWRLGGGEPTRERAEDLVRRHMEESERLLLGRRQRRPVRPGGLQEPEGAHDVCIDEVARAVDRPVDVALGGEVDDRPHLVLG